MKHITLKMIDSFCNALVTKLGTDPFYGIVQGDVGFAYLCAQLYQVTGKEYYQELSQVCVESIFIKDTEGLNMSFGYGNDGAVTDVKRFYIDRSGAVVAPSEKYDILTPYSSNEIDVEVYYVEKSGKAGVINDKLEVVLPLEYTVTDR